MSGRFKADAAGIKSDALAHQNKGLVLLVPLGRVLHHHQTRRTARPLAHGQQAAHAFALQGLLVQHAADKARVPRQFLSLFGQGLGVEQIGRRSGQIPGQTHGRSRILTPAGRRLKAVRHFLAVKAQGQPLGIGGFFRVGLFQSRKAVQGQLGRAHAFFNQALPAARQTGQGRFRQQQRGIALPPTKLHSGRQGLAHAAKIQFFARAQAHGQRAGHGQILVAVQQGQFALFALNIPQGRGNDQPGRCPVDLGALLQHGFPLAHGRQQDFRLPLLGVPDSENVSP